ncbi:MAG TPA: hypothetical protein VG269_07660 [Tepidisphaeraceae bacterium]|jgi:hypothetical protein|nr:hypothetical protein [Tepidisphaeraceae bacterium]
MSEVSTVEEDRVLYDEIPERLDIVPAAGVVAVGLGILGMVLYPFPALSVISEYLGRGGTIPDRGAINTFGLIACTLGLLISLMALFGGMGCMHLRAWARTVMLAYGAMSVALGIAGVGFFVANVIGMGDPHGVPGFGWRVEAFPVWAGCFVGGVYGAVVLWVMNWRKVREGFEKGERESRQ